MWYVGQWWTVPSGGLPRNTRRFRVVQHSMQLNARGSIDQKSPYGMQVNGGLFQAGDCHATQGDSEYDGTGLETSFTGR